MDEPVLRELAEEYLLPLFSGASLTASEPSGPAQQCVAFSSPCAIGFKVNRRDPYRLFLYRSQPFAKIGSGLVTERDVVEAFINVVQEIEPGLGAAYKDDLLSTFQRRVVASAIAPPALRQVVLEALDQLAGWATRLYEGKPISAALGIDPTRRGGSVTLKDIRQEDFSAVMTNGFDTLICFDQSSRLIGHSALMQPVPAPSFAPYRQGSIAAWAQESRIALVLNRLGEILLYRDQKLLFARRSGKWRFLTHEPVLTQMGGTNKARVRMPVYESCLDASSARTGACIGVVTSGHFSQWRGVATSEDDWVANPISNKARSIARMLNGRPFHQLDRRLRQELLAVDGATLIDHTGVVLAVGAILQIPGGSTGGGRLAAAKALAKLGLGIKVSQDGPIQGFRGDELNPAFLVM
jgi:hypothetical protein